MIFCIEDSDEALLDEVLTNLLRRNEKKGKNVIRTDKLSKDLLKLTNTVIGIDRIDLIDIDKESINIILRSGRMKNTIIYTCKNIYSIPIGLRLVTDYFAMPIKKRKIIKLIIFRNTPLLEKFITQFNLLSAFLGKPENFLRVVHLR